MISVHALPSLRDALQRRRPLTCAHRGGMARAPENTIAALRRAVAAGVDVVEVDVQLTADGHVVVLHDHELSRTTNGVGRTDEVALEGIRRLDAGSWFSPRFRGERVPTLDEVLEWAKGKVYLQIELKVYDNRTELLCQRVLDRLRIQCMKDQVMLISYDHHALRLCKEAEPDILTGAICQARLIDPVGVVRSVAADALCVDFQHLRRSEVELLHQAGIAVHSLAPSAEAVWRLALWGVDIVQSDDPVLFAILAHRTCQLTPCCSAWLPCGRSSSSLSPLGVTLVRYPRDGRLSIARSSSRRW